MTLERIIGEQKRGGGAGPGKAESKKAKQEDTRSEEGEADKGAVQLVGEACSFHKPGQYKQCKYMYMYM